MTSDRLIDLALLAFSWLILAAFAADLPWFFRRRSLRFLYRGGVPLYAKSFPISSPPPGPHIHRWQAEHWISTSPFLTPFAEQDGPDRVIVAQYIMFPVFPALMRSVVSLRPEETAVTVRGYASWSYIALALCLLVLAWPVLGGGTPSGVECFLLMVALFLVACLVSYRAQASRFNKMGSILAAQIPSHTR